MNYSGNKLRHEIKYFISYSTYMGLRTKMSKILTLDSNANESGDYFIRSLYFDDFEDTALYEKNFGCFKREKYRIRTYNYNDQTIKIERKSKFDKYINKESETISRDEYEKVMNGCFESLNYNSSKLKQEFYYGIKSKLLRPKVIVDYDREAYIGPFSDLRVTFDKDLRVGFSSNMIFSRDIASNNIFDKSIIIMEVKYNEFIPDSVSSILQHCTYEHSAISKYVYCRAKKYSMINI